jgi:hypothetical protein
MMQYVIDNPKLLRFMQMTANFWPQTHDTELTWLVIHRAYYLLVRIFCCSQLDMLCIYSVSKFSRAE